MKNLFLLSVLALICCFGCSKDKAESPFFVKFNVGSTQKSFTGYTFGHFETTQGHTELSILGSNGATAAGNYMGIYINNYPGQLSINTGTYEDNSTDFTVLGTYAIDNVEYYGGQTVSEDIIQYNIQGHNFFKATITEITSTNIRGTFSGDYYENGDVHSGIKLQITNGEFNVQVR